MLKNKTEIVVNSLKLFFVIGGIALLNSNLDSNTLQWLIPLGFMVGGFIIDRIWRGWRLGAVMIAMILSIVVESLINAKLFDEFILTAVLAIIWGGVASFEELKVISLFRKKSSLHNASVVTVINAGQDLVEGLILGSLVGCLTYNTTYWYSYLAIVLVVSLLTPEIWVRFWLFVLSHTFYKAQIIDSENIPARGGALLISNHVSPLDSLLLCCCTNRRIQFMVHERFFNVLPLRIIFRWLGVWRVPSSNKIKELKLLRDRIRQSLNHGKLVAIFPEGGISENGVTQLFQSLPEQLIGDCDVPIIPVRLGLLRGSALNLFGGKLSFNLTLARPMVASAIIGKPLASNLTDFEIRQKINEMGAEAESLRQYKEMPIHYQLLRNAKQRPFDSYYIDALDEKPLTNFMLMVRALIFSRKIRQLTNGEEYVGVMLPNCVNMVMTMYAVMLADAVPAVVNFTSGSSVRKAALDKAGVRYVLTSQKFLSKLNIEAEEGMIMLEDIVPSVTKGDKLKAVLSLLFMPRFLLARVYFPKSWKDVQRIAILLFSSGSSGVPKGVMLSHRNVNSDFYSFFRVVGWIKKERILGNLPLFHAYGMNVGFWVPAMARTQVIYMTNPLDATLTGKIIDHHKITMMMATPTFLQTYMRRCSPEQFKSLRLVITGGEKLRKDIAEKFNEVTGMAVVEGYGCTEVSPIVSINLAPRTLDLGRAAGKAGSIGVPMPGIFVKIVDMESGEALPPNQSGLLMVKGGMVMQGYLNDEKATAEVIVDGFYNTGDIAEVDELGYITITGRRSRFSKISGEMVPDELVESHLNELISAESRVLALTGVPDGKKGERLVVLYSVPELDINALIEGLRGRGLPNLWIPRAEDFHYVEQIPILGSGKLDLQNLKKVASEF